MCTVLAIGNAIWEFNEGSVFTAFLPREQGVDSGLSSFLTFWSYVIVLNTVVPISLYVRYVLAKEENTVRKQKKKSSSHSLFASHLSLCVSMPAWRSSVSATASS